MPHHYRGDIVLELRQDVYGPREDSELMAEAVEEEIVRRKPGSGDISLLDLGCGSGLTAIVAAKAGAKVTAVDINENAVELTRKNAKLNGVNVHCLRSDLLECVKGRFDIIAFNAPYLPEGVAKGENEAWAAGKGLEVIRRAVRQSRAGLNPGGELLLLISSLTGTDKMEEILGSEGFRWEKVKEAKVPWETLLVLKAVL